MEREFHEWLCTLNQPSENDGIESNGNELSGQGLGVPMGDDAAVIKSKSFWEGFKTTVPGIVLASDSIAEGTHFDTKLHSLERVGRKALAVNLSDIAAMGATPIAALLNLNLPKSFSLSDAKRLYTGAAELAKQFNVDIVGGDTNRWDGELVVGVTAIGREAVVNEEPKSWRLDTAQVGDLIVVSGSFGGSILGHHLDFQPRVKLATDLIQTFQINAATDVSDSLTLDLSLIASASGVGAEINLPDIPVSDAAIELSKQNSDKSSLEHALTDGEDFELILAINPEEFVRLQSSTARKHVTHIGKFVEQPGFWTIDSAGAKKELQPTGYSH